MKKYKIFFISIFLLLLISSYNNVKKNKGWFHITEIQFEGNHYVSKNLLYNNFDFLINKNINFFYQKDLEQIYLALPAIKNFKIKKIYPNKLRIYITEKKPIAIMQSKILLDDWLFVDINSMKNLNDKDLPKINGFNSNFIEIFNNLEKYNLNNKKITEFHLNQIGRWDIVFEDRKIIKLPEKNFLSSIKNFFEIENDSSLKDFKVFDYRIKDKLVLE